VEVVGCDDEVKGFDGMGAGVCVKGEFESLETLVFKVLQLEVG
jgi:hypothetical protein